MFQENVSFSSFGMKGKSSVAKEHKRMFLRLKIKFKKLKKKKSLDLTLSQSNKKKRNPQQNES